VYAAHFSHQLTGFTHTAPLIDLLEQYELPTHLAYDAHAVFDVLKMDKKRAGAVVNFVLLQKIGHAFVQPIALDALKNMMQHP
jgi:3-dehydroquinate synthetase